MLGGTGPAAIAEACFLLLLMRFERIAGFRGASGHSDQELAPMRGRKADKSGYFSHTVNVMFAKGRGLRGTQQSRERLILRASAAGGCGPRDLKVAKHVPTI